MMVNALSNQVRTGTGDPRSLVAGSRDCYIFTCKMSHVASPIASQSSMSRHSPYTSACHVMSANKLAHDITRRDTWLIAHAKRPPHPRRSSQIS
jgi:hypothetical protein